MTQDQFDAYIATVRDMLVARVACALVGIIVEYMPDWRMRDFWPTWFGIGEVRTYHYDPDREVAAYAFITGNTGIRDHWCIRVWPHGRFRPYFPMLDIFHYGGSDGWSWKADLNVSLHTLWGYTCGKDAPEIYGMLAKVLARHTCNLNAIYDGLRQTIRRMCEDAWMRQT